MNQMSRPVVMEKGIMQKLRVVTRPMHDQVEQLAYVNKIMDGSLSLDEYKRIIRVNYILHWAIETAISKELSEESLIKIQLSGRRKVGYLYSDLVELGLVGKAASSSVLLEPIAYASKIKIRSFAHALGMMYVLEGATLGGMVIKRELAKNAWIAHKVSFNYYGCYGTLQGSMWKEFKHIIEENIQTLEDQKDVIAGAKEAFSFLVELFGSPIE